MIQGELFNSSVPQFLCQRIMLTSQCFAEDQWLRVRTRNTHRATTQLVIIIIIQCKPRCVLKNRQALQTCCEAQVWSRVCRGIFNPKNSNVESSLPAAKTHIESGLQDTNMLNITCPKGDVLNHQSLYLLNKHLSYTSCKSETKRRTSGIKVKWDLVLTIVHQGRNNHGNR